MSNITQDRLNQIIDKAFDLHGEARDAFLDRECAGNEALRARVQTCIYGATVPVPSGFIEVPASAMVVSYFDQLASTVADVCTYQFNVGDKIGSYRIVGFLGQGGMGEVYLAECVDTPKVQQVALKVARSQCMTHRVTQSFACEHQILSTLEHENIVRLLHYGVTHSGLPFFAMEYVEGMPITEYCDLHKLSVQERLSLFNRVCHAVRYAQRKLVVHRDLKPSNILVTAGGQVKLLDFGIASLLDTNEDSSATERAPFTPAYAGPEQVYGAPVKKSTDVYALGVILYELLTGRRPYKLERGGLTPDNMRLICHHIPARPSHVVNKMSHRGRDKALKKLSALRASKPIQLHRLLRGDLDAIVMKALKKEPDLRYPNVAALWTDVNSYLEKRAICA